MDRLFKLDDTAEIMCESLGTRTGFRHDAYVFINGYQVGDKVKINYINRTWETFQFQSVLSMVVKKRANLLTETQLTKLREIIASRGR